MRRVFAVFVKEGAVEEWSREAGAWQRCMPGAVIEDPCLAEQLAVRALLDAAADGAMARALVARRHPVIEELGETPYCQGTRDALHLLLARRGLALDAQHRARIAACADPDMLDEWLVRAATATHAAEIFLADRAAAD